jgi:hypothetical protein
MAPCAGAVVGGRPWSDRTAEAAATRRPATAALRKRWGTLCGSRSRDADCSERDECPDPHADLRQLMRIEGAMIPDRILPPGGSATSRESDPGLFSGSAAGIGGDRAMKGPFGRPTVACRLGPPFRNQHVSIMRRQFETIADRHIFEVDAVDHRGVLAYQPHASSFVRSPSRFAPSFGVPVLFRRTAGFLCSIPIH